MMEERIRKVVGEKAVIRRPPNPAFGDYAVFVGPDVAEEMANSIRNELGGSAEKVEVAGKGFVNITLSRKGISEMISAIETEASPYNNKRVMVEYSNPNAFKEMHIGHLVGSVLGEAVAGLIEGQGGVVARDTFGGDVGPNVAKALWSLRKNGVVDISSAKELSEAYALGSKAYESDENSKEEIDALNKAIYAGTDEELMSLWKKGKEVSMEEFRRIWNILGTKFDFEFFDSDTTDTALRVVRDGLRMGVFEKSQGAVIFNGEGKGVQTMVFITSHETPTYEAKDIGLAFLKEQRWPNDEIIVVTGNEQSGRFKTVLAALHELAPLLAAKTKHIAHGFLTLATGKMSSREGNVITAADLISNVIKRVSERNEDPVIAQKVAIGAIKYMILRQAPGSDITYDPEKSLSLEGDSGPYLQYSLVRAKSVLEKAKEKPLSEEKPITRILPIEKAILHTPSIIRRAANELAPNLLVTQLTQLASEWNSFYAKERIIGGEHEAHYVSIARKFVFYMENGLKRLGIPIPEKM